MEDSAERSGAKPLDAQRHGSSRPFALTMNGFVLCRAFWQAACTAILQRGCRRVWNSILRICRLPGSRARRKGRGKRGERRRESESGGALAALAALRLWEPGDAADAGDEAAGQDQPGLRNPEAEQSRAEQSRAQSASRTARFPSAREKPPQPQPPEPARRPRSRAFGRRSPPPKARPGPAWPLPGLSLSFFFSWPRLRRAPPRCSTGPGPSPRAPGQAEGPRGREDSRVERSCASRLFSPRDAKQTRR